MLFNSNEFLVFLAVFLVGYSLVRKSLAARNTLIVVASCVFYGWWDYRFLALLLATGSLDFAVGFALGRCQSSIRRQMILAVSIAANLGVLFFFKYCDFFRESLEALLAALGSNTRWHALRIVLPVGISFYTFQSMSYVIDVYRGQVQATSSLTQFLAYVSFFPQLVAGPIERGSRLLPQFSRTLAIHRADLELGLWLMVWGLFKKVVLADNFAPLVDLVYQHSTPTGPIVVLGTVAFALQIYCDFSGYSDVARGSAKILGFDLTLNFNLPYFATSVREFWRRWHISLSTWLRDYLYVSLGGNRGSSDRTYLNLMLTMLLGGLWHGAALNFVLWGIWHGLGLALNRWYDQRWRTRWPIPPWLAWFVTAAFVLYGWMLFRAASLDQVLRFTGALGHWAAPSWWGTYLWNLLVLATPLLAIQLWQYRSGNLEVALTLPRWAKGLVQGLLILLIVAFWEREAAPFIYFQF